jgi:hypothetical protein
VLDRPDLQSLKVHEVIHAECGPEQIVQVLVDLSQISIHRGHLSGPGLDMHARCNLLSCRLLGDTCTGRGHRRPFEAQARAFCFTLRGNLSTVGRCSLLSATFLCLLSLVVQLGEKSPSCHVNPHRSRCGDEQYRVGGAGTSPENLIRTYE